MKRWFICAVCAVAAKLPDQWCGSHAGRAHEEVFLHRQHVAKLGPRAATAPVSLDSGNIAVIDDSGGVIGRQNPFNLDGKTLVFTPGASGYVVKTSGDTFDSDASFGGALTANFGDDDTRKFSLPFAFSFFGKSYNEIWVDSNGLLTFGGGDTSATGSFGYFQAALPAIAPLFTDLDPSSSSDGVRVRSEAGRFVVTWSNVPPFGSFLPDTFQVRLYPDGHIEIAYHGMHVTGGVVGISPGGGASIPLVDFSTSLTAPFSSGVGEIFAGSDSVDIVAAAQKFYQTHEDAYDYLVFYNSEGVVAGPGVVAYESTVRSTGKGYGDGIYDYGAEYGSARRLKSVLNLGPLSQYPTDANAPVPARGPTGDTPLTILGHESGHLFLALVSVPDPENPLGNPPMLGRSLVHWAYTFNSDASFLEGNRIVDHGASVSPRFETTATVQGYSALDQYLMGFLPPDQVSPMFAVLDSGQSPSRPPQKGVSFDGKRLDISIADIVKAAGARVPDSTVAQRRYRFGFVLIVPAGGVAPAADLAKVESFRAGFEKLWSTATNGIATADASLKKSVNLSLAPAVGLIVGPPTLASIEIATPAASPPTFAISTPVGVAAVTPTITIPAGQTRGFFSIQGLREGVEELLVTPSDSTYETPAARVQVRASTSSLRLIPVSSDPQNIVVRVVDANDVPFWRVPVLAVVSDGGSVNVPLTVTDDHGYAGFRWTPGFSNVLTVSIQGGASLQITPFGRPAVVAAVNSASFSTHIAPGSFVGVAGTNLGNQIFVNGVQASVYSYTDSFLNFVAPSIGAGPASIVVTSPAGSSDPFKTTFDAVAPGIFFEAPSGYGAILIAATADVTQVHPAKAGDFVSIYCTGLGGSSAAKVQIAGLDAQVTYAGPTIIPGLDQINAIVPNGVAPGTQTLSLSVSGISANSVKIQIGK